MSGTYSWHVQDMFCTVYSIQRLQLQSIQLTIVGIGGGKQYESFRGPHISLVGPIWRCFAQKTTYFLWKLGSLPAISKIRPYHYGGQKTKLSKLHRPTYQNVYKKGRKPMEKELSQSDVSFLRKIQKTLKITSFLETGSFRWFFGFFSKTKHRIDSILFPLVFCPSRTRFDR